MANWFVGMPVKAGVWLDAVLATAPIGLKHFHPDDLHMTIAFFGAYRPQYLEAVVAAMEVVHAESYTITLGGLQALPKPNRFSALSFSLAKGCGPAAALIGGNRGALCQAARVEPDKRPPLPHITIARPPRRTDEAQRETFLKWSADVQPPNDQIPVDRLALYTWSDDRRKRQFKILHERPLHDNV